MSWVYPPDQQQGPPVGILSRMNAGYASSGAQGDLVDSVKALQRSDPGAKQAWVWYTAEYGENTRDPSKHSAPFLEDFIRQYTGGQLTGLAAPPRPNGGGGGADDGPPLAELVKRGQRKSATWRRCWSQYRENYGAAGFKNDPAAHDEEFLVSFLEFLGSHGLRAFANMAAPMQEPPPMQMLTGGPPAKRPRTASPRPHMGPCGAGPHMGPCGAGSFGGASYGPHMGPCGAGSYGGASYGVSPSMGMGAGNGMGAAAGERGGKWGASSAAAALDPTMRLLVDRVKAFQRQSPENRELWGRFADEHLDGTKDPAKVEAERLRLFVSTFGVAELPDAQAAGAPPDPGLVTRVKAFQRNGDAHKQAWWQFCESNLSGTRDPARADSGQLQMFLDSVGA